MQNNLKMQFTPSLTQGILKKRYKRFLSDIDLGGEIITAHCPNPGSMLGLKDPESKVWVQPATNSERKLKYTWKIIEAEGALVGIDTHLTNSLAKNTILEGVIEELQGYESLKSEVKYGKNSRIDILLEDATRGKCYVEVKNVHLKRGTRAEFPDSVTARGAKHLKELSDMVEEGHRAVMLYIVQRGDCESFAVAADIDPQYAKCLEEARKKGVELLCYACSVTPQAIKVEKPLPIDL